MPERKSRNPGHFPDSAQRPSIAGFGQQPDFESRGVAGSLSASSDWRSSPLCAFDVEHRFCGGGAAARGFAARCNLSWQSLCNLSPLVNKSSTPTRTPTGEQGPVREKLRAPFCGMTKARKDFSRGHAQRCVFTQRPPMRRGGKFVWFPVHGHRWKPSPSCSKVSKPSTMSRYTPSNWRVPDFPVSHVGEDAIFLPVWMPHFTVNNLSSLDFP